MAIFKEGDSLGLRERKKHLLSGTEHYSYVSPLVPVTEHEYAIMKMLGMVSYWTFFHENLSEFTSGVFLATVKVGSIYVDFSSYNYETQMMMISKLFTIEKMKI